MTTDAVVIQPEIVTPPKRGKKPGRTAEDINTKHLAYKTLIQKGLTKTDACKALGYSIGSIGTLDKAVGEKGQKLSIVTDETVKMAHLAVKRLAKGKTFGSIETVKDSTALRAAEVILDRAEPKIGDHQGQVNITFTKVDLTVYE